MKEILYAVLVLGIMGAVFGAVLAIASKVFAVKTDERLPKLIEALPGANCGGCGFAGCQAYAQAVLEGRDPREALNSLMLRDRTSEAEDAAWAR